MKREAVTRHGLPFTVKVMKGYGHLVAREDSALFNCLLEEVVLEHRRGRCERDSSLSTAILPPRIGRPAELVDQAAASS